MKFKNFIIISIIGLSSALYSQTSGFDVVISDHFSTPGPSNLLNGSIPDTVATSEKWKASTKYQRNGTSTFVHLVENTSTQAGEYAFLKIPTSTENENRGSFFKDNSVYALSASLAVYEQSTLRKGYACFGFRLNNESSNQVTENKLPYM